MDMATNGNKQYAALGRLLTRMKPDVAQELMSYCREEPPPTETNLQKIPLLYKKFTQIMPDKTVQARRVFIASMLHMYKPSLFQNSGRDVFNHSSYIVVKAGFYRILSEVTGQ